MRIAVLALCLWLVFESAKIYPFYLAYFNEFAGGPANGYNYLVEGNLDWGQDLKGLAAYLRRNHIEALKLAYYGPDDPRQSGIAYDWLKPGKPTAGDIAISVTFLQGAFAFDPRCTKSFEWLKQYEPTAKIGYSIFVYRIPLSEKLPAPVDLPARCEEELLGSRRSSSGAVR